MKKPKRRKPPKLKQTVKQPVIKQHTKVCGSCPFSTKCEPGALGGSPPETYVAQTLLPYWVPCHSHLNYDDPNWKTDYSKPQCVGHAIMRQYEGVAERMPEKLINIVPYEDNPVFGSLVMFYAHHKQLPPAAAARLLRTEVMPMLQQQLRSPGNQFHSTKEFGNESPRSD